LSRTLYRGVEKPDLAPCEGSQACARREDSLRSRTKGPAGGEYGQRSPIAALDPVHSELPLHNQAEALSLNVGLQHLVAGQVRLNTQASAFELRTPATAGAHLHAVLS
jgi:hypothetical protein